MEQIATPFRLSPLVPAAGLFLLGVALGGYCSSFGAAILAVACLAWGLWLSAEALRWRTLAQTALAGLLVFAGMAAWMANQCQVERAHVVGWTRPRQETLAAVRALVLVAPDVTGAYGDRHWLARVRQICTQQGWTPAAGDMLVQSAPGTQIQAGMEVELYGWLARPVAALNPGAIDPQKMLAADRVFVQLRVPRASGVVVRDASAATGDSPLTALRTGLRGKLLAHLLQEDVPAAQALAALLLGHRDPAMAEVSRWFADAGVAHLLAISGSHIVFFTALVWSLLRFVPLRPRWRAVLIAAVVGLYVLATPCGPPIVRAAVALGMVVLARMLGRPRAYLNMVAAAAILVVILRPMDLFDAGFQLSFVSTAGLILFSSRLYAALFGTWLTRLSLAAELSRTRAARWRQWTARGLAGALTANLIGAATAAPLVAYHFGQLNLWAALAGLAALPLVSLAMVASAGQLLLELVGCGGLLSGPVAFVGQAMIGLVHLLAHVPGAALPLRAPPVWLVLCLYAVPLMWALRRRLAFSRAAVVNAGVAACVLTLAWYTFTAPANNVRLTVLSVGDGSSLLLRTPTGQLVAIDGGAAQGTSLLSSALRPALRLAGTRRLDGQILTALDTTHGRQAGAVLAECRPRQVWVSDAWWSHHEETLAGHQVAANAAAEGVPVQTLHAGDTLDLGGGCGLQVLWPPTTGPDLNRRDLILLLHYQDQRVLIADPAAAGALALLPPMRCAALVFTGPQRGAGDAAVRQAVAQFGAENIIWCARGSWAPPNTAAGEWNAHDGAVNLELYPGGTRIARD